MKTLRSFVAIDLSNSLGAALNKVIQRLKPFAPDMKWVENQNLHLTLHFLGDLRFEDVHGVCKVLEKSCQKHDLFELSLQGLGAFPSLVNPKSLWVGVSDGYEELVALQRSIHEGLREIGYPSDRQDFKPHITIGRLRKDATAPPALIREMEKLAESPVGVFPVESVLLMSSETERNGPSYGVLHEIELG